MGHQPQCADAVAARAGSLRAYQRRIGDRREIGGPLGGPFPCGSGHALQRTGAAEPLRGSAFLRLTKNMLLKGGIELPDPAREVVFPKGVPIVHMDRSCIWKAPKKSKLTSEGHTGATPPEEETAAATIGEGNLSNEVTEVRERSKGNVPEASENLLKG
jgi:hypothetical protein